MMEREEAKIWSLAQLMVDKKRISAPPYIFVLGAGASLASGASSTSKILDDILKKHRKDIATSLEGMDPEEKYNVFAETFGPKSDNERYAMLAEHLEGADIHFGYDELAELIERGYCGHILSTNFDPFLEDAAYPRLGDKFTKAVVYDPPSSINEVERKLRGAYSGVLLKLHGDLREKIFKFTPQECGQFRPEIEKLLRTDPGYCNMMDVIVIGNRLSDLDLNMCFEQYAKTSIWYVNRESPDKSAFVQRLVGTRIQPQHIIQGDCGKFEFFIKRLLQAINNIEGMPPPSARVEKLELGHYERLAEVMTDLKKLALDAASMFYTGTSSILAILQDLDIRRRVQIEGEVGKGYDEFYNLIKELSNLRGVSLVYIGGAAGVGKSTLLFRLAVDLLNDNISEQYNVIQKKETLPLDATELEELFSAENKPIYITVECENARKTVMDLAEAIPRLRLRGVPAIFLVAARTNEWNNAGGRDLVCDQVIKAELGKLEPTEVEDLLNKLALHPECEGKLAGKSLMEKRRLFLESERELLVALREATEGKAFDAILRDEYDNLRRLKEAGNAYDYLCLLYRRGLALPGPLLARMVGVSWPVWLREVLPKAHGVIVRYPGTGGLFRPRHRRIAEWLCSLIDHLQDVDYQVSVYTLLIDSVDIWDRSHRYIVLRAVRALAEDGTSDSLEVVHALLRAKEGRVRQLRIAAASERKIVELLEWGYVYHMIGNAEEELRTLRQALAVDPWHPEVNAYYIVALLRTQPKELSFQDIYEDVRRSYQIAKRGNCERADYQLFYATFLSEAGIWDEAFPIFLEVLSTGERITSERIQSAFGKVLTWLRKEERFDDLAKSCEAQLVHDTENFKTRYYLALAFENLERISEAYQQYFLCYSQRYRKTGEGTGELQYTTLRRAARLGAEFGEPVAEEELSGFMDAIKQYKKADTFIAMFRNDVARVMIKERKRPQAKELLTETIHLVPDFFWSYYNLVSILREEGNFPGMFELAKTAKGVASELSEQGKSNPQIEDALKQIHEWLSNTTGQNGQKKDNPSARGCL